MYESMKEHKTAKPYRQALRLTHKVAHFFGETKLFTMWRLFSSLLHARPETIPLSLKTEECVKSISAYSAFFPIV